MKSFLIIILFLPFTLVLKAQGSSSDKQAIEMLNEFYTAHCNIWAIKPPPKTLYLKLDSLQKKYCTQKLRKQAKESFNDVGYDLLTGDWGIDINSLKTMTILKDSAKENTYTVSYMVIGYPQSPTKPVNEHVILHVSLAKENGQLKIASIKDLTTRLI